MCDLSCGIIPFYFSGGGVCFLLVFEAKGKGHWNFPKGHPKDGESEKATALREMYEEVGVIPKCLLPGEPLLHEYSFVHRGEVVRRRIKYYLGLIGPNEKFVLQSDEISAVAMMTPEEIIARVPFSEAHSLVSRALHVVMSWRGDA